jgi:hypothetical protein
MADGAYDTVPVYAAIEAHGSGPPSQILIPPRHDAQTKGAANASSQRDAIIRAIDAGAEDGSCAWVRDLEQNASSREARWLLHCVKPALQWGGRPFTVPCNKAPWKRNSEAMRARIADRRENFNILN